MPESNIDMYAGLGPATSWQRVFCGRLCQLTGIVVLAFLLHGGKAVGAEPGPLTVLQEMSDQVLQVIRQDPAILDDQVRLRVLADEYVVPNVDFIALSQWVLGMYWRTATPEQRQVFADEFREMLIRTYLGSIKRSAYQDQIMRYLPLRESGDTRRAEVEARIDQPQGPPLNLQFRMLLRDDGWKVYDVVIEGISLVTTHRSTFASIIRERGVDGLIATLEQRNSDALGESAAGKAAAMKSTPALE